MAVDLQKNARANTAPPQGVGLFDLLYFALLDFLHIIQQLKFGIYLILVIAVMTWIGAAVPQATFGDTPAEYLEWYGPTGYYWIHTLAFDRIFHSGYFLSTLFLLICSVTLCAFGRLNAARKLAANVKPHTSRAELMGTRFHGAITVTDRDLTALLADLKKRQYTVYQRAGANEEVQLLVRRGLSAKWANVSMHFAFIIMAVGALLGIAYQLKETTAVIGEGEIYFQPDTGQRIRLVEYYQEYDPKDYPRDLSFFENPFPSDFKSHLQLMTGNGAIGEEEAPTVVREKTIEVNEPLVENHVTYYQQSFIQLPEFRFQWQDQDFSFSLNPGEPTMLPGAEVPLMIAEQGAVAGGYWLNADGSRGEVLPFRVQLLAGKAPEGGDTGAGFFFFPWAAVGEKTKDGIGTGIIVQGEPVDILTPSGDTVTLTLKGVREATVLQVKRDLGINIMYFAFGVCVFGILYPLFWPYHDGRMLVKPGPEGSLELLWGSRYRAGRRAFTKLCQRWLGQKEYDEEEDMRGDLAF